MKILYTSRSAEESARFLEQEYVPVVLEQVTNILNDALFIKKFPDEIDPSSVNSHFYEGLTVPTAADHVCVLWAAESFENFEWLLNYWHYLQNIHLVTFKFYHSTQNMHEVFSKHCNCIPRANFFVPPNLAYADDIESDFRNETDTAQAYRLLIHSQQTSSHEPIDNVG